MLKRFLTIYKLPILISLTLSIVLLALTVERNALNIVYIILGSFIGTFLLDLDYLVHIYFVETQHKNAGIIKDYLKHFDLIGYFDFVNAHKDEFSKKTFHSAVFQVVLGLAAVLIMASTTPLIAKVAILSAFVNSIYKFMEAFFKEQANEWFWSFKVDTNPRNMYTFLLILLAELAVAIIVF